MSVKYRYVRGQPVEMHPHQLEVWLTDGEWGNLKADANEVGCDVADLIALVIAYSVRARIVHAEALALGDILPWSQREETLPW